MTVNDSLKEPGERKTMRKIVLASVTALALAPIAAHAQMRPLGTIENSPNTIDNSPNTIENSPNTIRNSPNTIENSPGGRNGIYAPNGQWQGYAVPKQNGGLNIFDPSGNRTGYVPGSR
jgi:hypothetical protein